MHSTALQLHTSQHGKILKKGTRIDCEIAHVSFVMMFLKYTVNTREVKHYLVQNGHISNTNAGYIYIYNICMSIVCRNVDLCVL